MTSVQSPSSSALGPFLLDGQGWSLWSKQIHVSAMALFSLFCSCPWFESFYINGYQYATWQPAKEDGPPWEEEPEVGDKKREHSPKPFQRIHTISGLGQTNTIPLSLFFSDTSFLSNSIEEIDRKVGFLSLFFYVEIVFSREKKGSIWSGQVSVLFSDLDSGQFLENPIIDFFLSAFHLNDWVWLVLGFCWFDGWILFSTVVRYFRYWVCLGFAFWVMGYSLSVRVSFFFFDRFL